MMTSQTSTSDRAPRRRAERGFTLIELLVVMSIIAVLVGLLLPAVNHAVIAVRKAACVHRVAGVSAGLENFKADWGLYPPSDNSQPDEKIYGSDETASDAGGQPSYGYQIMALALVGPTAKGWGAALGKDNEAKTPFGGSDPSRAYGPYFQMESGGSRGGIADAFPSPRRPILYFRFNPRNPPGREFDYQDNPTPQASLSPEEGFVNSQHFALSAKYETPDRKEKWQRDDYLLICAGADRLFGYIQEGDRQLAATDRRAIQDGTATCDDITNY